MKQYQADLQSLALATKPARKRQLISLTPLIDVVFILLIFFMLASSFFDWREIRLDAPVHAATGDSDDEALLIEIQPNQMLIGGVPVSEDNLMNKVQKLISQQPDKRILVKPIAGVPLQAVVNVIDSIKSAGGKNLSLSRDATQ
ncbi:MAG: biopolymer transporter ExbD [Methylophaga sp.]|nr:MAG: biopolymer transporter ExbD [Methylophaga sp.]